MAQETDVNGSGATTPPPTGPEPTAFIISFDDIADNHSKSMKKMNITDSIRKFAPPKPDSIEKPRPVRSPTDNNYNNNGNRSDMKEIYGRRRQSPTDRPSSAKHVANRVLDAGGDRGGHLSDSATYLINRMLSYASNKGPPKGVVVNRDGRRGSGGSGVPVKVADNSWPKAGEKDSGVCDDNKSDAGTYTVAVDDEACNVELEAARKQIDQIFGVSDDAITVSLNSSAASSLNSPTLLLSIEDNIAAKTRQSLAKSNNNNDFRRQSVTRDLLPNVPQPQQTSQTVTNNTVNGTYTRTKRRPPTVEEMLHQNVDHSRGDNKRVSERKDCSALLNNNNSVVNGTKTNVSYSHDQHQRNDLSKVNNNNSNKSANRAPPPQPSLSAPSTPRSPFMSRRALGLKTNANTVTKPDARSLRKNSWSHCSEADCYESYNSDDSTHSSSHRSYNSGKDGGGSTSCGSCPSKMRFNRAFALRRARLGIETPGIDVNSHKTSTKSAIPSASGGRHPAPQKPQNTHLNGSFSRSDGGRFSLRVSNNNNPNKTFSMQNSSRLSSTSSRENVSHYGLQRKGSDSSGASKQSVISNRMPTAKSAFSDTDRRPNQSFVSNNSRANHWSNSLRSDIHRNYLQKSPSLSDRSKPTAAVSVTRDPPIGLPLTPPPRRRTVSPTLSHSQPTGYQSETAASFASSSATATIGAAIPSQTLQHKPPVSAQQQKSSRSAGLELSALDGLVVSAIHQLSQKLRLNMRSLLESQRHKHEDNSETTFLIDELLPQLSANTDQFRRSATDSGVSVSRDLSTILKNLKKLEQSFDVLNQVLDPSLSTTHSTATRRHPNAFFVVDV